MKICFTLDEVFRPKMKAIAKWYGKSQDPSFPSPEDFAPKTNDLSQELPFKTKEKFVKFLYEDYVFEIFGDVDVSEPMLDKTFNLWLLNATENCDDYDDIEVLFANPREFNASIGFTYFFLSKMATRVREAFFPKDSSEIWNRCDVLVTADPKLIKEKPEGKVVVKIETSYNTEAEADFSYATTRELLKDGQFLQKIHGDAADNFLL